MTQGLADVITQVALLDETAQAEIAALLRDEIQWRTAYVNSQSILSMLADEALVAYKQGQTKPINL